MRILIVITHLSALADLLNFSAQIVQRIDQAPTVLLIADHNHHQDLTDSAPFAKQIQTTDGYMNAKVKTCSGYVIEEIIRETNFQFYDLVILDEQPSAAWLARRWRKSVAAQVVEQTRCPVLIVRGESREIERILLCDSGGASSPLLTRFTRELADLLAGEEDITILHVMSQISAGAGVVGKQLRAGAQELIAEHTPEGSMLAQDLKMLAKSQVHTQPKVRHGLVLDEILSEVHSGDYDLVVIGAHAYKGWQRFLLDNLAQKIIAQINRPILVVKEPCTLEVG